MDAKQGLGTSMGFLAIVAVALHVAGPTGTSASASDKDRRPEANHATAASTAGAGIPAGSANPVIEGPWLATQTFFEQEADDSDCPDSEVAELSATSVVAGVPSILTI